MDPDAASPSGGAQLPSGPSVVVAAGANLWEVDGRSGAPPRAVDLTGVTRHPSDAAWCAGRGTLLVTDDDDARLHELDPSGRRRSTIDLADLGAKDPEGVTCAAEPDRFFVADGKARQVLELTAEGRLVGHFGVHLPFGSAEGIAWDPASDHLLLLSDDPPGLVELTREGGLVAAHDLLGLGVVRPCGVALAPVEDGGGRGIYVADAGAGPPSEGSIVELALVRRPPGARPRVHLVGDVDGFGFRGDEPGFALGDLDHDGLLEPGERLPEALARQDRRDPDDAPTTDVLVALSEQRPLAVEHALELDGAEPVWARLTLVIGGARALPGRRSTVRGDGHLLGEVVPTRDDRLAPGMIGASVLELPPPALQDLRDGRLRVEIAREPGTGGDDLMLDFSRLEVAVAGPTPPEPASQGAVAPPGAPGAARPEPSVLPDDLTTGTRVELEGSLSPGGEVRAREVEVKRALAGLDELEGRIDSVDAAGRRLVVAGVAVALGPETALTNDDGAPIDFADVAAGRRAESEGRFEDGVFRAHALEVEDPKPGEPQEVELGGVISDVDPSRSAFRVLGLRILVRSDTQVELD